MNRGYIYKVTNLLNGKWYIGSKRGDVDLTYYGSGKAIKRAINKYGKVNFKLKILCLAEDAYDLEELILTELDAANDEKSYNLINSGCGTPKGAKLSESTKEKIRIAQLGNKKRLGSKMTDTTRKALQKSNIGSKRTLESRKKMRIGATGNTNKRRPVRCIETDEIFEYLSLAENVTGISNISRAINKDLTAGGFKWQFADQE